MITMNIRGAREVERILRDIAPKEALRLVKATVSALATDVVREARKEMRFNGPYSTGLMRKETRKRQRRTRGGIVQTDVTVGKRAFYWRFYEYGDGNVPRRRMFGKSLDKLNATLAARWETLFMDKLTKRLQRVRNGPLRGTGRGR